MAQLRQRVDAGVAHRRLDRILLAGQRPAREGESSGSAASTRAIRSTSWRRPGAEILISINASPYHMGKRALRREIFAATARHHRMPVVYVNQVGGNDPLVFDGSSFAMDAAGNVIASAASFDEDLVFWTRRPATATGTRISPTNAKPSTRRWCSARATTSASADSSAC